MLGFYEDIEIGAEVRLGEHLFTRDSIVEFARVWDPQPFHLDEAAGAASLFGSLCASGWQNSAILMRKMVDTFYGRRAEAQARGEAVPPLGVSPGVANLRWPVPTRVDDLVVYHMRVTGKRETKRPQWGLVSAQVWGVNARGEIAIAMDTSTFVGRRPA